MNKDKILEIDKKISDLKTKKSQLEQKRLHTLARLMSRLGLESWDDDTLMGAFLFLKESEDKKEEWKKSGHTFRKEKSKRSKRIDK